MARMQFWTEVLANISQKGIIINKFGIPHCWWVLVSCHAAILPPTMLVLALLSAMPWVIQRCPQLGPPQWGPPVQLEEFGNKSLLVQLGLKVSYKIMEDGQASSHIVLSHVEVIKCFKRWMQSWKGWGECLCDELIRISFGGGWV